MFENGPQSVSHVHTPLCQVPHCFLSQHDLTADTATQHRISLQIHYAHRGFCRFCDDTAADIASSRTNAASPIARVTRSREARVTDLPDKTPRRAAFLSDQPRIERRSYQINAASRGVVVRS